MADKIPVKAIYTLTDVTSLGEFNPGDTIPVANGGTGVTSSTGTGSVVLSNSPTLVTPALGTPVSGVATNLTGLPISTGVSGLGTGVATFLGTPSSANLASAVSDETGSGALVFANSPTLVTPALGTPSSATLTNATGLPISTGVSGLGTGVATFLATPSSANLRSALTDETGSGSAVFATSPALVTPDLGTPSAATLTNATGLPISTGVSGLGTGVATALAVNVGSAGAPVVNGGALGTPSSGTVTNLTGTASININGTVGATTPTTGAFTTLTASGNVTLPGGTANGVTYLNGSKVLTSGSNFTYNNGLTVNGITQAYNTTLYTVDGTLSNYSAANGVYLAGNAAGWLNLAGDGTNATFVRIYGASYGTPNIIQFNTASSEKMRLDASGNLGIGTSSPSTKLDVSVSGGMARIGGASGNNLLQVYTGSVGAGIWAGGTTRLYTTGGFTFSTGATITTSTPTGYTDSMTLDSSGNLGIGVTTPSHKLHIVGSGANAARVQVSNTSSAQDSRADVILKSPTSTYGGGLTMTNGTDSTYSANVLQLFTYDNIPLVFGTNNRERARIDSSGNLLVGATGAGCHILSKDRSNDFAAIIQNTGGTAPSGLYIPFTEASPNDTASMFIACGDSTLPRFRVYSNGNVVNTNNSYGAISDLKLKQDITDCTPKLDSLNQVRIVNYRLKSDPEHKQLGVIAQELEQIFPGLVEESPDYIEVKKTRTVDAPAVTEEQLITAAVFNDEGEEIEPAVYETVEITPATTKEEEYTEREATGEFTKSVKYSAFVPMLIKAVQEQSAIIAAMEARLSALEAK